MKTQRFEVARLRGIEDRWRATPDSAAIIKEMSWDPYDGWKRAGGFDVVTGSAYPSWTGFEIRSLHYYSVHNGGQRHIIFEDGGGNLCRLYPPHWHADELAWKVLPYADGFVSSRHAFNKSEIATQSASFGGRMYFVNGVDEPVVYDGKSLSRVGFFELPTPPSATAVQRGQPNKGIYNRSEVSSTHTNTFFYLGTSDSGQGLGSLSPKGLRGYHQKRSLFFPDSSKDTEPYWKAEAAEIEAYNDAKLCGYQYRVSFVNKRGQESPMSPPSATVTFECLDGFRRFVSVSIPVGGENVVARRLYRTSDILDDYGNPITPERGRNFYFVKEIQDNETTAVEDGTSDANLGFVVDEDDFGFFPRQSKYIAAFKNTLFVSGTVDNLVRYSAEGMPEVFPRDNIFDIGDVDSGKITALYATQNALVIFKERGIYLVKGNQRNGFVAQTLNKDIGCAAVGSIQDVPGTGLVFLSESGVFVLKGALENTGTPTSVIELSTPIKHLVNRIDKANMRSSVSVINRSEKEYMLCVPTIGKDNNLLLVWHYEVGAWSFREKYPMQCVIETNDSRGYVYFGSNDPNVPGIHVLSNYYYVKNEVGYSAVYDQFSETEIISYEDAPIYETCPFDFGSIYSSIQIAYINVYAVAYGDNPLDINFKINRSDNLVLKDNKSREQHNITERLPVYGKAVFQDDVWVDHRPVVIRYDVSHMDQPLVSEMSLRFTQDIERTKGGGGVANGRMMIVGYSIDAKVGDQRDMRLLTDVLKIDKR